MFIPEVIPIAQWRGLSTWLKINLFTPHLILYLPGEADHNFFLAVPHSTSDEPILHGQYWMLHWALNRTVIQLWFFLSQLHLETNSCYSVVAKTRQPSCISQRCGPWGAAVVVFLSEHGISSAGTVVTRVVANGKWLLEDYHPVLGTEYFGTGKTKRQGPKGRRAKFMSLI